MQWLVVLAGLWFACWSDAASASVQKVVYSWPKSLAADTRGHYPIALLELALTKSGQPYQAQPSESLLSQYRTLRQLELKDGLDVVWTMTSPEREQKLRPIRIPIDRGLIGYRLLLIRQQDSQRIAAFTDAQIRSAATVQGLDWPDLAILKTNGFRPFSSNSFEGMFDMLQAGRVDYFPRSVTEAWPELSSRPEKQLTVAPGVALYYPAALYFFVNKDNELLASAIEQGLKIAMKDGSMKALFQRFFGEALSNADLPQRRLIKLSNPLLPAATPLTDAALWFDPTQGY